MILLRLISWPYARTHAVRSLLTVFGIVIGVAVFVSMHLANESVLQTFSDTVDRIAGRTELQITAGEPGFDEAVLERVQALDTVSIAVPIVEAIVSTGLRGEGNLLVIGVDMTGDRGLRDYSLDSAEDAIVEDPLVFLAQPDSIILTDQFAGRNALQVGDTIPLGTAAGVKPFTVRGILRAGGLSEAFGGSLAIMDVYAAQYVFGRGRKFDRIDLAVVDGARPEEVQRRLQEMLGPGFAVEPPASRGQTLESMSRVYSFMLKYSSAFALVIGMFIIYNAFAIAVTQRRKEIGILRALGATRRQIAALFLVESALAGTIGSLLGLGAGTVLAGAVADSLGALLDGVYGVGQVAARPALDSTSIALAFGVGLLTSMAAAFVPARNAARVDPVKALQKGQIQQLSRPESRARIGAAAALAAGSLGLLVVSHSLAALYVAYAGLLAAVLLLVPLLALWTTRAFRPLLGWIRPVEGTLAADSLIGAPRRTSATLAALMLSLALVVGLAGTSRSAYRNIRQWVDTALNPDLFVTASPTMVDHHYRLPASLAAEIASAPGVEEVQAVRNPRIRYEGEMVSLIATGMAAHARRVTRYAVEGDLTEMFRLAGEGAGVIVSQNFAAMQQAHVGTVLEIPTPAGMLRRPVVGVIREYSDNQGAIFVDRALYQEWWNDTSANSFRVYLRPDAEPARVRAAILERVGADRRLFVLGNEEVRRYIIGLTDRWLSVTWLQIAVAMAVAVLGIVNSLTVSISDRRRELGILQAVGGLRGQVRRTIWMEAIAIALVSGVLGLAFGAIQLYYQVQISYRDYPGLQLSYLYPGATAFATLPLVAAVAFLASLGPAESAVRGSLVESLEYE